MANKIIPATILNHPKLIFLMDAIGAFLTLIGLVVILNLFEGYIGMPRQALFLLSGIAICLFMYSLSCHLLVLKNWKSYLMILMFGNLIYGFVSVGTMIKNFDQLTQLGLIYFILEKLIILIVVSFEYQAYSQIKK